MLNETIKVFFFAGVYHLYDYQFFYHSLQENVGVRLDAYLKDRVA